MLDQDHLKRVRVVLNVLADAGTDLPHAIIACEDAFVALNMGLAFGLTMDQTVKYAEDVLTKDTNPLASTTSEASA